MFAKEVAESGACGVRGDHGGALLEVLVPGRDGVRKDETPAFWKQGSKEGETKPSKSRWGCANGVG